MSFVTAAVVQAGSPLFDTASSVERALDLVRQAHRQGAGIIVLPEAFIGGYPKGMDFGVVVGSRSAAGRDDFRRYHESAIAVPGPETDRIGELTAELGVHAVVGAIERRGGTLYCVALFFGPEGLVDLHRKLMPTAAERLIWGMGDGSTMPAVPAGPATLGAAICWENYMPLFRAGMYAKGVDVWCAPTVDDRDVWESTMRHIALEGRCFVLSANQFVDQPADERGHSAGPLIAGGSMIVSPLGEVLAGPLRGGEGILTAVLDLDDVARARFDLDVMGHYSRPDVFELTVDQTSRPPVRAVGHHR